MKAIDILMAEHRTVESVVDSLCFFSRSVVQASSDGRETLLRFVELLRLFDKMHHMKEEDMLFDKMIANGFPRDEGPLAVMLSDHTACRSLVSQMDSLASQVKAWNDNDRHLLGETATEYTLFLKSHIAKEDNVLYPMSQRQLPEAEWESLDKAFDEFEAGWKREGRLDEFRRRVTELREAWPAEDGPTPSGGCGF
ncbi:MAG: hemerythrin domain-containing protein [Candidatus Binatia bacterium]